jgi:hypothetical protein
VSKSVNGDTPSHPATQDTADDGHRNVVRYLDQQADANFGPLERAACHATRCMPCRHCWFPTAGLASLRCGG